jgi:hypothetical protein
MSSTINRRLAFSAAANAANAAVSASLGRLRVSLHDGHSSATAPIPGFTLTNQLHSATWRLAHNRYWLESTAPPCSLSSPEAITSNAMLSREKPSAPPHDKQTEFSNARCCPQLGQVKSRMQHFPLERRPVGRGVDHASLRAGGAWVIIDCSHLHAGWASGARWIRVPAWSELQWAACRITDAEHGDRDGCRLRTNVAATVQPATVHTIRRYLPMLSERPPC